MDKVNVLGVNVNRITMEDATNLALSYFEGEGHKAIFTPNPEIIMKAYRDPKFKETLNSADLVVPDGIGVVKAGSMLGKPFYERVGGFDLIHNVFAKMNGTVYLFGSKPGTPELAKEKIEEKFPNVKVVGTHNGYFEDDSEIIDEINQLSPDFLLVCLGCPRQEDWIIKNRDNLNVKVMIGAGGTLDGITGSVKRAPNIFIKLNLEWFYRLCQQPSRIGRMMDLPKFVWTVWRKGEKQGGK